MAQGTLTKEAIRRAISECDKMGRAEFLRKYEFRGARGYFLVVEGQNYDSKAIVAAAYQWLPDGPGRALKPSELSGGFADAAKKLRKLGFDVATPGQNADWTWEEHVLAFDMYMRNPTSPPGKASQEISDFSALLNRLGERTGVARTTKYRNANGVYMKMMNFRRFDPSFQAAGKSGLSRGNEMERAVWDKFSNDLPGLYSEAAAIRLAIDDDAVNLKIDDEDYESEEGRITLRLHRSRERSPTLIRKKKAQILRTQGRLACEVCGFDFAKRYGDHGAGFIEVHHRKPVAMLKKGDKTRLSDLAVVCSNCHRMLHRTTTHEVAWLRGQLTPP